MCWMMISKPSSQVGAMAALIKIKEAVEFEATVPKP